MSPFGWCGSGGRNGETEAQQGGHGGLTAPWFPAAARAPGGERDAVITFRPLMSRPELARPRGLPRGWREAEQAEEGRGAKRQSGGF